MSKPRPDCWGTNPARISSVIGLPAVKSNDTPSLSYTSPVCGLGWKFDISRTLQYRVSAADTDIQERRSSVTVTFRSNLCQGMKFRDLLFTVKVTFTGLQKAQRPIHKSIRHDEISRDLELGTFDEPFPYNGETVLEVKVQFSADDQLSFPVTPSTSLTRSLASSLDAGQPRAVYGNAGMLVEASTYFKDLLSGSEFQGGVRCDIYDDPPEVLEQLSPNGYESDSDLDDVLEAEKNTSPSIEGPTANPQHEAVDPSIPTSMQVTTPPTPSESFGPVESTSSTNVSTSQLSQRTFQVQAYAINGTAHLTWKAFVYYVYSNEIHFKPLKSRNYPALPTMPHTACSPKSMYRLADYANLPDLKHIAKEGIKKALSEWNVVGELFSRFTSRYDEIIEMEAAYLVGHFTPRVSKAFDEALESIVKGLQPHCHRTLAFTIKRLRKPEEEVATTWNDLKLSQSLGTKPAKGKKSRRI